MTTLSTSWTKLAEKSVSYSPWAGTFSLWAKIVSTDVANNRTKVAYDWDFETTAGYSVSSYDAQDYVTGAGWNSADYRTYSGSGTLRSGEEWITHNADGTKSSSCSGRTRMGGVGVDTDWVSASFYLPRIPRASSPTVTPNPQTWSNTSSNTITVNTNRKASSFTHSVRCDVWSYVVTKTGVGASTTFDIPYSTLGSMPDNVTSFTGSVYTQTYSGSTAIGSEVRTPWTIQIDTTKEHPNIGTVTLSEGNSRVAAIVNTPNTFVQGISTLVVNAPLTVTGSYTQLANVNVANGGDNQTYTLSGTSGTLSYSSANNRTTWLTITLYDKRGTTAVSKPSWTLLSYAPLTVTGTVGRTSSTGSVAVGQVSGVAYGGEYGQSTNSLTISYRYKEHDATTWIDGAETFTRTLNAGQQTYTYAMTFSEAFDYQKQYDVEFTVSDLFSTATYTAQLMQGLPILSWDETEVDVWGSLHIHDRDNPTSWQDVLDGFDAVLAYGAQKNLAIYDPRTVTVNGITYQINANGEVKATGTATAYSSCNVGAFTAVNGEEYILSGCPEGGGERTYSIGVGSVHDYGEGATVTGNGLQYIYIDVFTGETVDMTIYPMVRDARIANEEFETPLLCTRYFTSSSVSVSANSSASTSISITVPSGYRVLAILRSWTNGDILTNYISTSTQSLQQGQASVTAWVRNPKSSASTVTVSVEVLFIRA